MDIKLEEVVINTSNIEEMKGKFLAERLLRVWNEDFADEDTGEVVSIERSEVIFEKGIQLESHQLSEINFLLQSGDIKTVLVSDQQRGCNLVNGTPSVWVANIQLNGKKKNIYLYANSLKIATDISIDYIEQKYFGNFRFLGIKELDYSNLIPLDMKDEDASEENDYYKMEVEVTYENEEPSSQTYIVNSSNAEIGKVLISDFISIRNKAKEEIKPFNITIISAKTIPCNDIVDYEFSKNHLEKIK